MGDSAQALMSHAKRDLSLAEEMSRDDDIHPYGRAFHSQQAAEKYMKAVIIASGRRPEWTHDLVSLASILPPGHNAGVSDHDLQILTRYATLSRYSDIVISKKDADAALDTARAVMQAMRPSI